MRHVLQLLGRTVGLGAVILGLLLAGSTLTGGYPIGTAILIGSAALAALAGGVLYLLGLDRISGRRGRVARMAGWVLFTIAFGLPTSVTPVLFAGSALALPAAVLPTTSDK